MLLLGYASHMLGGLARGCRWAWSITLLLVMACCTCCCSFDH